MGPPMYDVEYNTTKVGLLIECVLPYVLVLLYIEYIFTKGSIGLKEYNYAH